MVESLERGLRQVGGDRAGCALFANPRQMLACFLEVAALQQLEGEERVRLGLLGVARGGFEQGIGRNIVPQETQDRHWPRRLCRTGDRLVEKRPGVVFLAIPARTKEPQQGHVRGKAIAPTFEIEKGTGIGLGTRFSSAEPGPATCDVSLGPLRVTLDDPIELGDGAFPVALHSESIALLDVNL